MYLLIHQMKTFYTFLLFILTISLNAQTFEVEYMLETNRDNPALSYESLYLLKANKDASVFKPKTKNSLELYKLDLSDIEIVSENNNLKQVKLGGGPQDFSYLDIYYNNSNTLVYNRLIVSRLAYVRENDLKFEWEIIENDSKSLLGYKCTKAVTQFRGRVYEAYFSPDLLTNFGPWKFSGLPGLILSIKSIDGYFSIIATSISIKNNLDIINPFKGLETISLEQFVSDTEKLWLKNLKAISSNSSGKDDGGTYTIKFDDSIEDLGIGPIIYEY